TTLSPTSGAASARPSPGGSSQVKMINGIWAGSRFGLKGSEDLGGGTKAIFQLEQGFNSATGAQSVSGLAFNRQAWVGITNGPFGIAAGIQRIDNGNTGGGAWGANSTASNNGAQPAVSAINNGFQTAAKQQRVAVTGGWAFNSQWDVSFAYSNVQYVPGVNSF